MMLYPPMSELVSKVGSRYLLVNRVARRARDISQKAEEAGQSLDRKPSSRPSHEGNTAKLTITRPRTQNEQNQKTREGGALPRPASFGR